ncbi:molybdopterin-dependent oxidoreductase [Frankia sp. AgKG'84/4]|uniref:molybdopterin-dependent oxidoreductase n=1 Tax=Frankia sp. AgKG'84/4 TaxID=573490 RepID=UPI0020106DAD|nr:molybdopterin-dependent oxidoreductase [Frankia sp. AgKG'84/4]MCL9796431.1 molybdopterin-dependent oxidoreductase [Frankia sp. AgKG'84/4]
MLALGAAGVAFGGRGEQAAEGLLAPIRRGDPTGLTDLVPVGGFRYYTVVDSVQKLGPADYRLRVHGLVDQARTLSLADLGRMRQTTLVRDFQCVTGWRVGNVRWSGVLLRDLLDAVGVQPAARALTLRSFDGSYTESLTLAQATRPDVLVALRMLDAPVTHDHGGPVRLYVAPMYGYKSIKWLGEIEAVAAVEPGYWERRGYDVDGWIGRSNGRDDDPV